LTLPLFWLHIWTAPSHSRQAAKAPEIPPIDELQLSPIFTPEVQRWSTQIFGWAQDFNLSADLIATVMQIESCGHPTVSSSAGALGLFQVMPFHFGANEDPLDVQTNATRGLAYLARALELSDGDPALALAGYNGGHSLIAVPDNQWPGETVRYVAWGGALLADVATGLSTSPALNQWLSAGGRSLCSRAAEAQLQAATY
jgi:soluble lytic murein transglycosylase-like protein